MEGDLEFRNRQSLERLRLIAGALSDVELRAPIDPPWTAATLFAHIAFWERFTLQRWLEAQNTESGVPVPFEELGMELVNRAGLPSWLAMDPRAAVEQCLAASEDLDAFLRSLEPALVSRVLEEGRPRLVDRCIHRTEHLETIVTAFKDRLSG